MMCLKSMLEVMYVSSEEWGSAEKNRYCESIVWVSRAKSVAIAWTRGENVWGMIEENRSV